MNLDIMKYIETQVKILGEILRELWKRKLREKLKIPTSPGENWALLFLEKLAYN
jgi:hypothetical protein